MRMKLKLILACIINDFYIQLYYFDSNTSCDI